MSRKFDVAVIGAGPAGYVAAIRLSQLGKAVCVIDEGEERLGGVCLNEGCIPVKSMLMNAKLYSGLKNNRYPGAEAGVKAPDMGRFVAEAENASLKLRSGIKALFRKYGVQFISGRAGLLSPDRISVLSQGQESELGAVNIIIATGSSPALPPGARCVGDRILTSSQAVKLKQAPKTLLVIGAGAIGMEFSSLFSALGAKVTVAEMMGSVLPFEDAEVSKAIERSFKKRGIDILLNTKLKTIRNKKDACETVLDEGGKERTIGSEYVLIAAGRKPNTDGIGLKNIEVKTIGGFIVTDDRLRTTVGNIYAAGDVVNTPMYAHVAYKEGLTAAENIAGINVEPVDYGNIPSVVFTEPQVASVGLTESRAKSEGYDAAVSRQFFRANGLAVAAGSEEGFIKIIADKKTHRILGAHIIGAGATEMVHEFVIAKSAGLRIEDIAKAVHAHPTFSESAADAARAVFGKPIHG